MRSPLFMDHDLRHLHQMRNKTLLFSMVYGSPWDEEELNMTCLHCYIAGNKMPLREHRPSYQDSAV
jgi:hypothetical protein